ncbi:unnamed protein product [Coffea canephora]|uniref:Exopolygalacturonase-like n=1 Tax=Coffea canephora TaxID=49390 RepID=A0A068TR96_COFCA|nr:unnamed protein product [Coffea canephora]
MAMDRRSSSTIATVLVLCSSLASCNAAGGLPRPAPPAIFNVVSFGAKPGNTDSAQQAFMRAWNAACKFVGPRASLFVPPGIFTLGEVTFEGPCSSQSPIVFQVAGTLQAVSDVSAYSGQGWISFDTISGLVITGGGTIDGRGQNVWQYNDCKNNGDCVHLPASFHFNGVKNAKIKGVSLVNAMGFHMHVTNSYLFRAHSLTITAPPDSPNTDGMHVSKSNTVKIARSVIRTGDDCVSIGPGATNVTINKVTCGPGHGISIGSLGKYPNELDVRGLIVKNCTLQGTTNGVRIKTYAGSGPSVAAGMRFSDIVMENVLNPIIIDQNYGGSSTQPSQVRITDVVYENIRGTTSTESAISLKCSPSVPCQNMYFTNINLRNMGSARLSSICANAQVISSGVQTPTPCLL